MPLLALSHRKSAKWSSNWRAGANYTEVVVDGVDSKVIVIPEQGIADHTVIVHDFEMKLTVFKDLTTKRCAVLPLYRAIWQAKGVIFTDITSPVKGEKYDGNIILEVNEKPIENVVDEVGEKIDDLCQGFPVFWARINRENSIPLRVRRGIYGHYPGHHYYPKRCYYGYCKIIIIINNHYH